MASGINILFIITDITYCCTDCRYFVKYSNRLQKPVTPVLWPDRV